MALLRIVPDVTGSRFIKMAASIPEVVYLRFQISLQRRLNGFTSGLVAIIMVSYFRLRRTIYTYVPLISRIPKIGGSRWNGVAILSGS